MADFSAFARRHLLSRNPLLRLGVGLAPALAVTATLMGGVLYSGALLVILPAVTALWALIHRYIPKWLSLPLYMVITALITAGVQWLLGLVWAHDSLLVTLWVPLTALSALMMGPVRDTAQSLPIGPAVLDALGVAGGAAAVCIPVGLVRELLGTGQLLGWPEGGILPAIGVFSLPVGGLILFAVCAWLVHRIEKKEGDDRA